MFPLKKSIIKEVYSDTTLNNFKDITEIPNVFNHPGSFGYIRKNHVHEGIDLYCDQGDEVFSIEDGEIMKIIPFTGEIAGSPWWNNTYSVLVKHRDFYINYGEIIYCDDLFVGQHIKEGFLLGYVTPVLKVNKGRPMNMLHLEAYDINSNIKEIPVKSWEINKEQPTFLLNPIHILKNYITD